LFNRSNPVNFSALATNTTIHTARTKILVLLAVTVMLLEYLSRTRNNNNNTYYCFYDSSNNTYYYYCYCCCCYYYYYSNRNKQVRGRGRGVARQTVTEAQTKGSSEDLYYLNLGKNYDQSARGCFAPFTINAFATPSIDDHRQRLSVVRERERERERPAQA
jgi:hypothetical protein